MDVAELERVYGKVRNPDENPQRTDANGDGHFISTEELVQPYENQIHDLQAQLTQAMDREQTLICEKTKLLDLLSAEKEEKRALMPPADETPRSRNWLFQLLGAR